MLWRVFVFPGLQSQYTRPLAMHGALIPMAPSKESLGDVQAQKTKVVAKLGSEITKAAHKKWLWPGYPHTSILGAKGPTQLYHGCLSYLYCLYLYFFPIAHALLCLLCSCHACHAIHASTFEYLGYTRTVGSTRSFREFATSTGHFDANEAHST